MADVRPFRGIRYAEGKDGADLSRLLTQPYDVISPARQKELHESDPHNVVHIDFGVDLPGDVPGNDKYARAAGYLKSWLADGTMVREGAPAFYYYEQEFDIPGYGHFVRKGFLCALRLSAFNEGTVYPHEKTLAGPKVDRMNLTRATDAQTSAIFGLYSDKDDAVVAALRSKASLTPDVVAADEVGVKHRMWVVTDEASLSAARKAMDEKKIFIADGHHRYETALAWRNAMRDEKGAGGDASSEFVLIFLSNMSDSGLLILPTHRGVHSLAGFDEPAFLAAVKKDLPVETKPGGAAEALAAVASAEAGSSAKAIAWTTGKGNFHVVTFPDPYAFAAAHLADFPLELRALDVVLLHGHLFRNLLGIQQEDVTAGKFVTYYKEASMATSDLAKGAVQAAFFINPVSMTEFMDVSLSGHVLPQKSTFFYPKILTGLLLYPAGASERL